MPRVLRVLRMLRRLGLCLPRLQPLRLLRLLQPLLNQLLLQLPLHVHPHLVTSMKLGSYAESHLIITETADAISTERP